MGGSGGGFFPSNSRGVGESIKDSMQDDFQKNLDGEVNGFLQKLLVDINKRNSGKIQKYLEEIKKIIGDRTEIENLLYGGSVAKHTYVDGLSDIDALAILDRVDLKNKTPQQILNSFHKLLQDNLTGDKISEIRKGQLAITIKYHDGTEIQILPALKKGDKVLIKDFSKNTWNETKPKVFLKKLNVYNKKLNNVLVPTIKLAKSIILKLPDKIQPKGYHIESLAIEAFKKYDGPCTSKAMLQNFFEKSSKEVLTAIKDVTGQSKTVDDYLGKSGSIERKNVSVALSSIAKKLNAATTLEQWESMFED